MGVGGPQKVGTEKRRRRLNARLLISPSQCESSRQVKDPGVEHVSFSRGSDFRERSVRVTKLGGGGRQQPGPNVASRDGKALRRLEGSSPVGTSHYPPGLYDAPLSTSFARRGEENVSVIHSTLGFQDLKSEQSPACE